MTRADQARLATFFARPEWREIRPLLEKLTPGSTAPIEAVVRKVRVEIWRDFSQPRAPDALTPEEGAELLRLWEAEVERPVLGYEAPTVWGVVPPCPR